jgi:hypothetical protein
MLRHDRTSQRNLSSASHVRLEHHEARMIETAVEKVSQWRAVLAALLYLATLPTVAYGIYAVAQGGRFLESVATAYPWAVGASAALFICLVSIEAFVAMLKRLHAADMSSSAAFASKRRLIH